jgi:hypothetical protein
MDEPVYDPISEETYNSLLEKFCNVGEEEFDDIMAKGGKVSLTDLIPVHPKTSSFQLLDAHEEIYRFVTLFREGSFAQHLSISIISNPGAHWRVRPLGLQPHRCLLTHATYLPMVSLSGYPMYYYFALCFAYFSKQCARLCQTTDKDKVAKLLAGIKQLTQLLDYESRHFYTQFCITKDAYRYGSPRDTQLSHLPMTPCFFKP